MNEQNLQTLFDNWQIMRMCIYEESQKFRAENKGRYNEVEMKRNLRSHISKKFENETKLLTGLHKEMLGLK